MYKLTPFDVALIRAIYKTGDITQKKIAEKLGVHPTAISYWIHKKDVITNKETAIVDAVSFRKLLP